MRLPPSSFCHHSNIASEMSRFCMLARQLLSQEEVDPFYKAAWLQWAFVRIHPFEDGNGRLSRIIASLPFCMLQLPPIVVCPERKHEYFQCLQTANLTQNVSSLADFFRDSLNRAMTTIEQLPEDSKLGPVRQEGRNYFAKKRFPRTSPNA